MHIRIYCYDGVVPNTTLRSARCVTEFEIPSRVWKRRCDALLRRYEGDFYTINEQETCSHADELLCRG